MKPKHILALATLASVTLTSYTVRADVRADEKSRVEFAGMLGHMFSMFGGKAAKEGVTSTDAVNGDRKVTLNDTTGQIVDLSEEKVYDLDLRKKSYKVTTFDELRRRMEEARRKAEEDARKEEARDKGQDAPDTRDANQKEIEVDFNVKNTGEKKAINGYDTHQALMTIAVREKGKTLEQSGGLVLTSDMWLAPTIDAMKEVAAFDTRYAQKLYGPMPGLSAEQMAAALAMYPMMKQALARMAAEGTKLDGTAIQTTTTMEAVKSAEQLAQEAKAGTDSSSGGGGISGRLGGMLAKKIGPKKEDAGKARSTFMTTNHEVLKVVTDVTPADVAVPAGFKESK
jgi:hypothetical protein